MLDGQTAGSLVTTTRQLTTAPGMDRSRYPSLFQVNTLQLVFLAVEGAAISCAAACYLAYLLRAVAAQRYKLYGTFLVIPVVRVWHVYVGRLRGMGWPARNSRVSIFGTP